MSARLAAFVIWAAVAASAVFWLLRLSASSPAAPAHTVAVATGAAPRGDLTRVLGAPPAGAAPVAVAEPALASRFKLIGVAAPREGGDRTGLALIAVDGKPARGFKVGAAVEGDLVLQSVTQRSAALGAAGAATSVKLELPPLPPPATSNRPPMGLPAPVFAPGGAPPIATLPQVGAAPPPASETQEPAPVPPPPAQPGALTNTR